MARLDKYLEKLNGGQGDIPAPQSSLDKQMATLAESGGGGGGVLYVTITSLPDPETDDTVTTCDKTYAEIDAALTAGTPVIGKFVSEGYFAPMMPMKGLNDLILFLAIGYLPLPDSPMLFAATISIAADDTITMGDVATATMTPMGG